MKISFAICTKNEGKNCLEKLFSHLYKAIEILKQGLEFEIVILDDFSTDPETIEFLQKQTIHPFVRVHQRKHEGHFADHKNYLNSLCHGQWILNLDADEYMRLDALLLIPQIINSNPKAEAFWIPRANVVTGLTAKHVQKWGWILYPMNNPLFVTLSDKKTFESCPEYLELLREYGCVKEETDSSILYEDPLVMWPDYQMRLYKNIMSIKWQNKVHEQITGYSSFSKFPNDPEMAIMHFKTIERQTKQNNYYETL